LAEKSAQADRERASAIQKENETRQWLEKMTKDKEYFESQYNDYKRNAGQQVSTTLGNSRSENGFESVLGSLGSFMAKAAPFVTAIASFFG